MENLEARKGDSFSSQRLRGEISSGLFFVKSMITFEINYIYNFKYNFI